MYDSKIKCEKVGSFFEENSIDVQEFCTQYKNVEKHQNWPCVQYLQNAREKKPEGPMIDFSLPFR